MDPGWAQLLVVFLGGSLMAAVITGFVHCIFHPVISVCVDEGKGTYGPMTVYERDQQGNVHRAYEARYFRLYVENTGLSSIKSCSGYITKITKYAQGMQTISRPEVVTLGWANHGLDARDIPRGAFFHLDIAALDLILPERRLRVGPQLPTSLAPLFTGERATYEIEVLVAADNARPSSRMNVQFAYDPRNDELEVTPLDKTRYPWWACWKWRLLRFRRAQG
jgi:hypothetical protein